MVQRLFEKATGPPGSGSPASSGQHRRTGGLRDRLGKRPARPFPRGYTPWEFALLAEANEAFGQISCPA